MLVDFTVQARLDLGQFARLQQALADQAQAALVVGEGPGALRLDGQLTGAREAVGDNA